MLNFYILLIPITFYFILLSIFLILTVKSVLSNHKQKIHLFLKITSNKGYNTIDI